MSYESKSKIDSKCQPVSVRSYISMVSYSLLFIYKKLCRARASPGMLINLSKQTLDLTKLDNLSKKFKQL